MAKKILLPLFLMVFIQVEAQTDKRYRIFSVAFYNVENLFDIHNDSLTYDDDRTPSGKDRWTRERYGQKLSNISRVLSHIGREETRSSPDIIGLCELENLQVLDDLTNHPDLRDKNYGIIHFDSPDERGIDVALLYKRSIFFPISFKSHRLLLTEEEEVRDYTRDQLVVGGLLDGEEVHFIVNHWPSRSGGEQRSRPNRIAAAKLNRHIIDSITNNSAGAKIISMGDLNDDPTDYSLKKVLKTKGKREGLEPEDLYNPMEALYKKGYGSLAYRDNWNLFDQIFLTANFIIGPPMELKLWKANIFKVPYLIDQKGRYKGYPLRTYANGNYVGGYSDHFPVYILLIKEQP